MTPRVLITNPARTCLPIKVPVAVTSGAAHEMLEILYRHVRTAFRKDHQADTVHFQAGNVKRWAKCGPGDEAEPVVTVMLEGEG